MAPKKEEEKDEKEKPWTPADPLPEEDDENETQRRARATARHKFLEEGYLAGLKEGKKKEPEKKKSSLW